MEIILLYAVACMFVGWLASYTTLGFGSAFLLSVVLTPVTGFIVYLFYPAKSHRDQQLKAMQNMHRPVTTTTDADELLKLKSLLDAGALSQAEYDKAKAKIIG